MTSLRRLKTVLFDIDGTLIDSNGAHACAWVESLREQGVDADAGEVRRLIGMGGDKLLPAVAGVAEDSPLGQATSKRKKEIFDTLLPTLSPTNGSRPLLEYLRERGLTLAVATSADDREVTALLKQAGVEEFFDQRASKEDAPQSKPAPDIVHAAMRRTEAQAGSTLLIGDTPYDIEAAQRAGVDAIVLRCGGYWPDARLRGAIEIFDDPRELLERWRSEP